MIVDAIMYLKQQGFYVLIVGIFVYAITDYVLSKIMKDNPAKGLISLSAALIVITFGKFIELVEQLVAWYISFIVIVFLFLVAVATVGGEDWLKKLEEFAKTDKNFNQAILGVGILIFIFAAARVFSESLFGPSDIENITDPTALAMAVIRNPNILAVFAFFFALVGAVFVVNGIQPNQKR
ncbi:NEQ273 [Nanoarchaeum equitans Kin4-M]|uniref:NEQ273 n=1 Tax=Nanoarchaeum equitans (strain Kin4-M) TaxID=228908 RepID=Q74NG3_NANEQ|nr:NEQ273 [Nanoarchaeum equitans Kin4-M]